MDIEQGLEIFGAYETSADTTKIIKGCDNIDYMIGGNARHNIRSNIMDWRISDKNLDVTVREINKILDLSTPIKDPEILNNYLHDIINQPKVEFLNFFEKSLKLKDSIHLQLRRLFSILDKYNNLNNQLNDKRVKFCPFEPVVRIHALLDSMNDPILFDKSEKIMIYANKIKDLVNEKKQLIDDKQIELPAKEDADSDMFEKSQKKLIKEINEKMEKFLELYSKTYSILNEMEQINCSIAKNLESINNILES